jgi:hypothetical protein
MKIISKFKIDKAKSWLGMVVADLAYGDRPFALDRNLLYSESCFQYSLSNLQDCPFSETSYQPALFLNFE